MKKIESATSFDLVDKLYDSARFSYPESLYDIIDKVVQIDCKSKILEIGAGSGIATSQLSDRFNPYVTALEPGIEFTKLLLNKFKNNSKIKIVKNSFENYKSNLKFDHIVSATAFHWLDPITKYLRSRELLKMGGKLILFWSNYSRDDSSIFDKIQEVYKKFHPEKVSEIDIRELQRIKQQNRFNEIADSGCFKEISHSIRREYYDIDKDRYLALLRSFSNNIVRSDQLDQFYQHLGRVIEENGNRISLPVDYDLIIGERV